MKSDDREKRNLHDKLFNLKAREFRKLREAFPTVRSDCPHGVVTTTSAAMASIPDALCFPREELEQHLVIETCKAFFLASNAHLAISSPCYAAQLFEAECLRFSLERFEMKFSAKYCAPHSYSCLAQLFRYAESGMENLAFGRTSELFSQCRRSSS